MRDPEAKGRGFGRLVLDEARRHLKGRALTLNVVSSNRVALELYKRRHGSYPTSLEQLTPGLLPAVPLDRFNGKPLRYELRDGKPLLYSVGADYEDNGGAPSPNGAGLPGQWVPRTDLEAMSPQARRAARLDIKGDWILWPLAIDRVGAESTEADSAAPGI